MHVQLFHDPVPACDDEDLFDDRYDDRVAIAARLGFRVDHAVHRDALYVDPGTYQRFVDHHRARACPLADAHPNGLDPPLANAQTFPDEWNRCRSAPPTEKTELLGGGNVYPMCIGGATTASTSTAPLVAPHFSSHILAIVGQP